MSRHLTEEIYPMNLAESNLINELIHRATVVFYESWDFSWWIGNKKFQELNNTEKNDEIQNLKDKIEKLEKEKENKD